MRKTFKLQVEGKHPDRVLDAIKHEVRKYVKRQRRVPLPAGVDFWDFDCKFGSAEESAEPVHLAEINFQAMYEQQQLEAGAQAAPEMTQ